MRGHSCVGGGLSRPPPPALSPGWTALSSGWTASTWVTFPLTWVDCKRLGEALQRCVGLVKAQVDLAQLQSGGDHVLHVRAWGEVGRSPSTTSQRI